MPINFIIQLSNSLFSVGSHKERYFANALMFSQFDIVV